MKAFKLMVLAATVLFASSIVLADGIDARVNVNPGPDPPAIPTCGSAQFFADQNGAFNVNCDTNVLTTQISFAALDNTTMGGLSCASNLTSLFPTQGLFGALGQFNWTSTTTNVVGGVDSCTFTAPAAPTGQLSTFILGLLTQFGAINDGDCDSDDFIFGIAAGCGINFTTNAPPGQQPKLFTPGAAGDVAVNGAAFVPLPEPSSIALLGVGFAALLFVRRRYKNSSAVQAI